ncbi:hypothetical protein [Mycobacterium sp. PSTR-4-N]|uniref:hypothetical protein n=1 Tax=Mycobacterium sp. PSTR-4-N TaxID=2917745 RepID=UPI001F14D6A3|nr:hypothetical protein [Mycobacterium sp. PSTR-4-N]MCG7594399.1 hypothetical protein [Mycobacterium sp. PSTR-4-N]
MVTTHLHGRHRRSTAPAHAGPRWGLLSMIVAGGMAGWLLAVAGPDGAQPATVTMPHPVAPVAVTQDVQRAGQVTAVSPHSLTTVDADGKTTTFAITPDTARVLPPGSTTVRPAQHVVVVGAVRDGVLVATAIADRDSANGGGPPMDYQLPN